jgi:hypothetical protein
MNLPQFQYRQSFRASIGILFALLLAYAETLTVNAQQPTTIIIYSQSQVSEQLWAAVLQSLRADLAPHRGEPPYGLVLDRNPTIIRGNDRPVEIDGSSVIGVKLLGPCDVLPQSDRAKQRGPLGWVLQVSGRIQPFIFIDCTRIGDLLRATAAGLTVQECRHQMSQAIAHVLIHEWIHIATQNSSHGDRGVTKRFLSAGELIAEPGSNRLPAAAQLADR